jgi:hypothetical protein
VTSEPPDQRQSGLSLSTTFLESDRAIAIRFPSGDQHDQSAIGRESRRCGLPTLHGADAFVPAEAGDAARLLVAISQSKDGKSSGSLHVLGVEHYSD